MAIENNKSEVEFSVSKSQVFEAMYKVIPTIRRMEVEKADELQSRILIKSGMSNFSWGENIYIQLTESAGNKTKVQITSLPKMGSYDEGKNQKNIDDILRATSWLLQQGYTVQPTRPIKA